MEPSITPDAASNEAEAAPIAEAVAEAVVSPRDGGHGPASIQPATDEVLVLDFGGQYSQLIARRVRECGVFSELLPHTLDVEEIRRRQPKGLILSGGPASVYADGAPKL